jgi:uncharacterized protein YkwD
MRKLLATLAAGLVVVGAPSAGSARPTGSAAPATQLRTALLAQINAFRAANGRGPLRLSPALTRAASGHSGQMVRRGFFSHNSASGTSFSQRIARFYTPRGFRRWSVGENIVWGGPDIAAASAFRMWAASPMHRANMLSARWREIGLGAVHSSSAPGVYGGRPATVVTADFGSRTK